VIISTYSCRCISSMISNFLTYGNVLIIMGYISYFEKVCLYNEYMYTYMYLFSSNTGFFQGAFVLLLLDLSSGIMAYCFDCASRFSCCYGGFNFSNKPEIIQNKICQILWQKRIKLFL
jgi:hypothetical protein